MTATVTLGAPLRAALAPATEELVAAELAAAYAELGGAGPGAVTVRAADGDTAEPVALAIGDHGYRVPDVLLWEALAYAEGTAAVPPDAEAFQARAERAEPDDLARAVALVCRAAVIRDQPPGDQDVAPPIDLLVEPGYLRAATLGEPDGEVFPYLRDEMFRELGVPLPPLRLRADATLSPGGFALRINGVRRPPRIGPPPGSMLVNDTAERLALWGAAAEATLNPATRAPGARVAADQRERLEAAGLTTWGPLAFVLLTIAGGIRRNAHVLLWRGDVEALLNRLAERAPLLVAQAEQRVGADRLTPVLQDLLRDEVPVRNLRRILELLLRFTEDAPAWDPAAAAAHVRAGMADGIASQAARGTETVVVYLVDPALERLLEAGAADAGDRLAAALRAEREHLPRTAMVPVVLTRSELRARVRALLAPEFPEQRVIGYAELPPGFNVQPVARLAPV